MLRFSGRCKIKINMLRLINHFQILLLRIWWKLVAFSVVISKNSDHIIAGCEKWQVWIGRIYFFMQDIIPESCTEMRYLDLTSWKLQLVSFLSWWIYVFNTGLNISYAIRSYDISLFVCQSFLMYRKVMSVSLQYHEDVDILNNWNPKSLQRLCVSIKEGYKTTWARVSLML